MPFHLAAFEKSLSATLGIPLHVVEDTYLPNPDSTTSFLLPFDLRVVAAYAASPLLSRARIVSPRLLRTAAFPYIRPLNRATLALTDPNFMPMVRHPLLLNEGESLSVEVYTDAGPSEQAYALIWLATQLERVPAGEAFKLLYTSNAITTLNEWTRIQPAYDQVGASLPPGTYAVVGLEHWCQAGVAARLILRDTPMRPGSLIASNNGTTFSADAGLRTASVFYDGTLGVYGYFDAPNLPDIEVLQNGVLGPHEGYLTVIRVNADHRRPGCGVGRN